MFHYRKTRNRYMNFPKPEGCPFCDGLEAEKVVTETEYHRLVPNRVSYDLWELRRVTQHLLLIPKRHVASLSQLTDEEKLDHINLIAKYEADGYNIYARGVGSLQRSVVHQHTHLIKTGRKQARGSFTIRKPYFLITF